MINSKLVVKSVLYRKAVFYMEQILLKDKKYSGRYVALEDYDTQIVIADGKDPQEAYEIAVNKGFADPVILYVPVKGMVQIY